MRGDSGEHGPTPAHNKDPLCAGLGSQRGSLVLPLLPGEEPRRYMGRLPASSTRKATMQDEHRWSALDGLRALAVAIVVAYHFGVFPPGGALGVDLFFVISGFLITSLLVRERDRSGHISVAHFWVRRALRLFPALACAVALAFVVALVSTEVVRHDTLIGLPWVLLYSGNWARAFDANPNTLGILGHTWSLAVEEQFYLVWPLVCIAWIARTTRRNRAAGVMAALAALDCLYLIFAMNAWGALRGYYGTDTHAMGLLAGSALALAVSDRTQGAGDSQKDGVWRVAGAAGLVAFVMVAVMHTRSQSQSALMITAATFASVLLVASVSLAPARNLGRFFSADPARWIGQRSYGIYLYHVPILGVFVVYCHWQGLPRDGAIALCIAVVVLLADLSYRFVESPFLRLKARFGPARTVQARRESDGKAHGQGRTVPPSVLAEVHLEAASR